MQQQHVFRNRALSRDALVMSITSVIRKVVRNPTPSLDRSRSFASFSIGPSFFFSLLSIIRSTIRYVIGSVTARPMKAAITESSISSSVMGKDGAD